MKNRTMALIVMIIAIVSMVACGIRSDKDVTSGEMVVPEVSSEDLLVSSLEYLLLDDDALDSKEQGPSDQDTAEQAEQNVAEKSEDITEEHPVSALRGEEAVVYYGDGGSVALKQETIEVHAVTPDELIGALARHNIVSLDTKVLSFEQEEEDGVVILHLDLSKSAGEYLRTMSREAECIIVAAVVNTFLENYDANAVYIMVEGEALVTPHTAYTEAIGQCTPEALLEMLLSDGSDDNKTDVMTDTTDEAICNLPLAAEEVED